MSKQVQDAYIVAATRTPIGRSGRGYFRNTRPDDLLVAAIRSALAQVPSLDPKAIEDAIIGCSFPEGEQGMNMARVAVVLAGLPHSVGGVTVNRFCASGLTRAADGGRPHPRRRGRRDDRRRRREHEHGADGRQQAVLQPGGVRTDENVGIAYGMGLTAEKVAAQWKVSREAQDAFALESHQRALKAHRRRRVRRRDDADRGGRPLPQPGQRRDRRRRRAPSARRRPAPRHLARRPGQAEAGVRRQGQRDRRQQLADQRRRRLR